LLTYAFAAKDMAL